MEIRKTKTDSIDAAIIADMLRYQEPPVEYVSEMSRSVPNVKFSLFAILTWSGLDMGQS